MTDNSSSKPRSTVQLGYWSAVLTAVMAALFISIGVLTPARTIPYPYTTGLAAFVPGDYIWMIPGLLLAIVFVVLMASVHSYAAEEKKVLSQVGLSFAIIYAAMNTADYFIQLAVMVPSILKGELAGLSLFSEYNPHGVFLGLESLGYFMMSISFLFAAFVFAGGRLRNALRWLFVAGFILAVGFLLGFSALGYDIVVFEVAIITVNCAVLIGSGIMLSLLFKRPDRST